MLQPFDGLFWSIVVSGIILSVTSSLVGSPKETREENTRRELESRVQGLEEKLRKLEGDDTMSLEEEERIVS